jgi:hypothetical protein
MTSMHFLSKCSGLTKKGCSKQNTKFGPSLKAVANDQPTKQVLTQNYNASHGFSHQMIPIYSSLGMDVVAT